jgi:hypothetical protein
MAHQMQRNTILIKFISEVLKNEFALHYNAYQTFTYQILILKLNSSWKKI